MLHTHIYFSKRIEILLGLFQAFHDALTNPFLTNLFIVLLDQTDDGGSHKTDRREEETTELCLISTWCTGNFHFLNI